MDFLMVETMLWAKAQGYRWFELGMAPLAGLRAIAWRRSGASSGARLSPWRQPLQLRGPARVQGQVRSGMGAVTGYPRRSLATVLADVAALIAGGRIGVIRK